MKEIIYRDIFYDNFFKNNPTNVKIIKNINKYKSLFDGVYYNIFLLSAISKVNPYFIQATMINMYSDNNIKERALAYMTENEIENIKKTKMSYFLQLKEMYNTLKIKNSVKTNFEYALISLNTGIILDYNPSNVKKLFDVLYNNQNLHYDDVYIKFKYNHYKSTLLLWPDEFVNNIDKFYNENLKIFNNMLKNNPLLISIVSKTHLLKLGSLLEEQPLYFDFLDENLKHEQYKELIKDKPQLYRHLPNELQQNSEIKEIFSEYLYKNSDEIKSFDELLLLVKYEDSAFYNKTLFRKFLMQGGIKANEDKAMTAVEQHLLDYVKKYQLTKTEDEIKNYIDKTFEKLNNNFNFAMYNKNENFVDEIDRVKELKK